MRLRQARRAQPGAVDEHAAAEVHLAGMHDEAARHDLRADQLRLQREHRAAILGVAEVGEHQRMAVDDPGRRRVERRRALHLGLERLRLLACHPDDVGDAVGMRFFLNILKLPNLVFARRDDQLARAAMRHAVRHAVLVEQLLAGDAAARLERALRVVDAGVDHFRVARAGMGADRVLGLEDHDLAPGLGEGARDRQADHARADHRRIKLFHAAAAFRR